MNSLLNRITLNDQTCNGKPTIRNKRITVQTILEFLGAGDSQEDILKAYPTLEVEDIKACLLFASELMKSNYNFRNVA